MSLQLPGSFKEFALQYTGGKGPDKYLVTHCNRELFHAQWEILLDDDFLIAYEHGILIQCYDGVTRRLYPRIFTYSADYPEKSVLLDCHLCYFLIL
jgi:Plavaka transposase